MRPFAATSIPLQDPDVIPDRLLALGRALRISLTSALGNRRWRADRTLSQDILDAGPISPAISMTRKNSGAKRPPNYRFQIGMS
ncbi:hypothetical protein ELI13_02455 [Rhizobium ruizarguesonis]|nr:hypothetical protein ELI34_01745 [Rhizobium ruizarguesonis]TAV26928.1 hypothetical protein ELI35_04050 [Rhizobium ruizarguesonis]TAV97349.1 hypothetical protein ELI24_02430 [Rhizobium ruizarguesonis]TAW70901.1 hypothetical protein ELI16_02415 [Rhizobium ruizarguesonis]TAW87696.1 hypothetical protein ELI13_02455 [Rhizobium ruizarguesonis]